MFIDVFLSIVLFIGLVGIVAIIMEYKDNDEVVE